MRLHHFSQFGFAALTLGLLSGLAPGCAGGQTGDLSGEHDGEGTNTSNGCDEHKEKLASFDEMTDAGSAAQVLAYAEKTFDAPITWKTAPSGQDWTLSPETGQGQIHVEVTRGKSAYRLTYTAPKSSGGESLNLAPLCPPPQLGVEAHVSVTTDGGALSESFDTLLRTAAPGVTTLSVPLDFTKLDGALAISFANPDSKLVQPALGATLMAEGMTGAISGMLQTQHGTGPNSAVSAMGMTLGVWPDAEACRGASSDGSGIGLPIEAEALGVTGTDTLASVATSEPVAITWLDGSATTLSVGLESTADGCFYVSTLPAELGGGATLTYPVQVKLKSEDGRLDGSYLGKVTVTGSGSERTVTAEVHIDVPLNDAAQSGFSDIEAPSGSDGLRFNLEVSSADGVVQGLVRYISVADADCDPAPAPADPMNGASTPGCAGQTQTELEKASWTN
jgi:hypothetical protein